MKKTIKYEYKITYEDHMSNNINQVTDNPEIAANWFYELSKKNNIYSLKLERVKLMEY